MELLGKPNEMLKPGGLSEDPGQSKTGKSQRRSEVPGWFMPNPGEADVCACLGPECRGKRVFDRGPSGR
ncbi:hypothetical protein AMECASPLE_006761 [Ameca splendens]|uniref:Uncharacterized protein n=1 Tax=Ameca splendens TaxID=208324 RepID=A0ABV1A5T0_9TELE